MLPTMEEKKIRVICAFCGSGKSSLVAQGKKFIDLDSAIFNKQPHVFPKNYINTIKLYLTHPQYDDYTILVSTHRALLDGLSKAGIHHLVVGPAKDTDKYEWSKRFEQRNDTQSFISLIDRNWELFMQDIEEHCTQDTMYCKYIPLEVNQYLKDVI